MDAISENHLDFLRRVKRIEANVAKAQQLLYVGVDEVYVMPRKDRKPKRSRTRMLLGNLMYPVSLVAAVLLGVISHAIGQVARFHLQGAQAVEVNPDVEMLSQVIVGIVVSMALGFVLGLNGRAFTTLKSFGVVCGMFFFHNFVHFWPKEFATVTSTLWVSDIVAHTKPYSLMWRGITFLLS